MPARRESRHRRHPQGGPIIPRRRRVESNRSVRPSVDRDGPLSLHLWLTVGPRLTGPRNGSLRDGRLHIHRSSPFRPTRRFSQPAGRIEERSSVSPKGPDRHDRECCCSSRDGGTPDSRGRAKRDLAESTSQAKPEAPGAARRKRVVLRDRAKWTVDQLRRSPAITPKNCSLRSRIPFIDGPRPPSPIRKSLVNPVDNERTRVHRKLK